MPSRDWNELLAAQQAASRFVCVGLDTNGALIPEFFRAKYRTIEDAVVAYNCDITAALAA